MKVFIVSEVAAFYYTEDYFNELIEAYFIYYENKYFTGGNL